MSQTPLVEGFTRIMDCDMATAEDRIRVALAAQGFGVLTEIDVAATLKMKLDLDRPPLKILGACNPKLASEVLERDDSIALMLPCNVVIDETPDGVRVRLIDPLAMMAAPSMADLASDAATKLSAALEQA